MALKTEQLLTLKQLPSIGDAKVFLMANYAIDMSIDGIKDYKLLHLLLKRADKSYLPIGNRPTV